MINNLFGFSPISTPNSNQGLAPAGAIVGNVKRKSRSFSFDEDSNREAQSRRIQSPPFERRSTCPYPPQPELIHDNSNTASDTESPGMEMDQDMDQDMGGDQMMGGNEQHAREGNGISVGYSFGNSGSGGFGFGPGAEEDEEEMVAAAEYKNLQQPDTYPSITAHPNPHHFTNQRSASPLNAQAFSARLRSPPPSSGLYQPTYAQPLAANASEIEKARSVHGSHCKSIPRLQLSQHADPVTGKQSMWTWCPDCQTVERAHDEAKRVEA